MNENNEPFNLFIFDILNNLLVLGYIVCNIYYNSIVKWFFDLIIKKHNQKKPNSKRKRLTPLTHIHMTTWLTL